MCIRDRGKPGPRVFARVTCFEVHLQKPVGHVGKHLRILVGHFDKEASKLAKGSDRKKDYYSAAATMILNFKQVLLCCDANMALLETIDLVTQALSSVPRTHSRGPSDLPRVSLAAWFPHHFVDATAEGIADPTSGLGLDSLGMFAITYPDAACKNAALAETTLYVGIDRLDVLSKAENDAAWEQTVQKQDKTVRRFFRSGQARAAQDFPVLIWTSIRCPKAAIVWSI